MFCRTVCTTSRRNSESIDEVCHGYCEIFRWYPSTHSLLSIVRNSGGNPYLCWEVVILILSIVVFLAEENRRVQNVTV